MVGKTSKISVVLNKRAKNIRSAWIDALRNTVTVSQGRISDSEVDGQVDEFLQLLKTAADSGIDDVGTDAWGPATEFLEHLSASRARQGFRADETATFIFSLKKPLFEALSAEHGDNAAGLAEDVWSATALLDKLGLQTFSAFQRTREEVIARQQEELLELSTPVVKLWEGVLALPMIGTLDSRRTQIVMESLLQKIVETGSEIAIIDITGVPTVDTLVAQHLLKTVTAIRLMGADCIISGVRPQIAQTIVHLGLDLQSVTTKANLADALSVALKRSGFTVGKTKT